MTKVFDHRTPAADLVDFESGNASGLEFGRDTVHLFCSPLFVEAMKTLMDKNIKTISCGSGRERGILPGITGDYDSLNDNNKELAKDMLISPKEFRIGVAIEVSTTLGEYEDKILKIANRFLAQ